MKIKVRAGVNWYTPEKVWTVIWGCRISTINASAEVISSEIVNDVDVYTAIFQCHS